MATKKEDIALRLWKLKDVSLEQFTKKQNAADIASIGSDDETIERRGIIESDSDTSVTPDNDYPKANDNESKPSQSYIALIASAILNSAEKRLVLSDIYKFIMEKYTYFQKQDKSWRNSIRHNLSLNECFIKAGRSEQGKGHYWAIHPANYDDFSQGDFRRRRARRRVRRSFFDNQSYSMYNARQHTIAIPQPSYWCQSLVYQPPKKNTKEHQIFLDKKPDILPKLHAVPTKLLMEGRSFLNNKYPNVENTAEKDKHLPRKRKLSVFTIDSILHGKSNDRKEQLCYCESNIIGYPFHKKPVHYCHANGFPTKTLLC